LGRRKQGSDKPLPSRECKGDSDLVGEGENNRLKRGIVEREEGEGGEIAETRTQRTRVKRRSSQPQRVSKGKIIERARGFQGSRAGGAKNERRRKESKQAVYDIGEAGQKPETRKSGSRQGRRKKKEGRGASYRGGGSERNWDLIGRLICVDAHLEIKEIYIDRGGKK